jgi:hypothetical protein
MHFEVELRELTYEDEGSGKLRVLKIDGSMLGNGRSKANYLSCARYKRLGHLTR